MPNAFTETLRTWQNFYFMTGGAAATLIGLLFVGISLGARLIASEGDERFHRYITPILIYYVSVLLLACAMLVPAYPPLVLGILLAVLGIVGGLEILRVAWAMLRVPPRTQLRFQHFMFNVVLPAAGYILLAAAGIWLLLELSTNALYLAALGDIVLLTNGIWRSWEAMVWVAQQGAEQ